MTIIFYDIPSAAPEKAFSPSTWRIRLALNYKGLSYRTKWVEMPDIESLGRKLGVAASTKMLDGSPWYTLPVIQDTSTGICLSDSLVIAEYLEKTYPDTPFLFPHNTLALQAPFFQVFASNFGSLWKFIIPAEISILNPASIEHFRTTREEMFRTKPLEDIISTGEEAVAEWAKVREGWTKVDTWYAKNNGKGLFLLGETPSWADFVVAAFLIWIKVIWGEGSQQWKDISSWNGGRWKNLLDALSSYIYVQ